MKSIGGLLLFLGLGSIVLSFLGMEFRFLAWIDMWGVEMGWVIRVVMILAGGGLLAADKFMGGEATEDASVAAPPAASQHTAQGDALPGMQPDTQSESQSGSHGQS